MAALGELEEEYDKIREDESYQAELKLLAKDYVGRPTPLYYAENLTRELGGARIFLKREDLLILVLIKLIMLLDKDSSPAE